MFLLEKARSVYYNYFLQAVPFTMVIFALDPAVGISWFAVPDKHTNVQQGRPFSLRWHYKMDDNETFWSSEIEFFVDSKPYPTTMASRHMGENTYYKHQRNDPSFSVFGKYNVTLSVRHSDEIGHNITYCCQIWWKSVAARGKERKCSKIFVYAEPQIPYHIPLLSCKQGDSIKLQCNTTGIPSPHVEWIHDDTLQRIGSSSDISLNITGRRSGGQYCCDADNGFGRDTACTAVNVTEYEPENTRLEVKHINSGDVNIIHIECKAVASPPANQFIMTIDDKEYNSSNGVIEVPAPSTEKIYHIAANCIPRNKYGHGPMKKDVFRVNAPPTFITPLPTLYNMTVSGIAMKCETKGSPTPTISWISEDSGNIVSTGKYYNVSYVKCATKTMTFFCNAKNEIGNIRSPEIRVNVMTKHNCSTADKGLDETTPTALKSEIIAAITCACILVGLVVAVAVGFRMWIKASKVKNMDENIYNEPIDAVDLGREEPLSLARITSTNDDYATVEEFGVPTSLIHVETNVHPTGEEPLYERLVPIEI
ncbi:hemicentin-1-like [Actinia tenebrosa]|uniref:Hemicentin-1-like n=1 Tax=Actinia tenebrosa TaxID=6105 RepID=A0A6P8HMY2_ACTTE|nr:hemicentin-1-like [Actinia tenebrosa]